jgi:succinoglycan biosynthesis transport protein ExoP
MPGREFTLVAAARRRMALVIVSALAGLAAAVGLLLTSTPSYTSSIQLHLAVSPEVAAGRNVFNSLTFIDGRAATYSRLVGNDSFEEAVAAETGSSTDLQLTSVVDPETALLRIDASGATPEQAQQAATAAANRLIAVAPPLDNVVLDDVPPGTPAAASVQLTISEPADLPVSPTSPVAPLYLVVGLVVGTAMGLAGAVAAARADQRIREPEDLADLADRVGPVFWLPARRWGGGSAEAGAEDYQLRLAALHHEFTALPRSRGAVLVLCAPTPQHAAVASQIAGDLAAILGEGGRSTALVRMQPRDRTGSSAPGLSDVLAGTHSLSTVMQNPPDASNVSIDAGTHPLRLLTASPSEVSALLADITSQVDVVVIDAPDLGAPAGTAVLSGAADAVLVVAGRGSVRADELLDARATVGRWNATYLGVLLAPRSRGLLAGRRAPATTPVRNPARIA